MAKVPDDTDGLELIIRHSGAPAVDLAALSLTLGVLEVLPEEAALAHEVLPLRLDDTRLSVATTRPDDATTVDELAFLTGRKVIAYAADPEQLRATIRAVYQARRDGEVRWHGPKARSSSSSARPRAGSPGVAHAIRREPLHGPQPMREPFAPESSVRGTPPRGEPRPRPYVLVVDDEPAIRRIVKDALAQRGYEVCDAASGNEAFRLIKHRDPDAILLDAVLPDVHGFDVCKRLKTSQRYQHIPILMVTAVYKGWRMAADLKEAYGVAAVVEKPFDLHHLVRLVEGALAGRSLEERPSAELLSAESRRLYHEGAAAYKRGDLDAASTALAAAVAIDPLSATLRHQLGLVHAHRGQDFAAIQELEAAIDLEPGRYQTLRNLAVLYQKHGFRRKACESWERAIVLAPDDVTRGEIKKVLVNLL